MDSGSFVCRFGGRAFFFYSGERCGRKVCGNLYDYQKGIRSQVREGQYKSHSGCPR